jgi:hypothetical protein
MLDRRSKRPIASTKLSQLRVPGDVIVRRFSLAHLLLQPHTFRSVQQCYAYVERLGHRSLRRSLGAQQRRVTDEVLCARLSAVDSQLPRLQDTAMATYQAAHLVTRWPTLHPSIVVLTRRSRQLLCQQTLLEQMSRILSSCSPAPTRQCPINLFVLLGYWAPVHVCSKMPRASFEKDS